MKEENLYSKSVSQLEKILWDLCKKITRKLYKDCYTCSQKNLEGINCQTGHYFPKGALGGSLKYALKVLRLQCFQCNINHGGMGGTFRENMAQEIGEEEERKLYAECTASKGKPIKAKDHYIKLILEYRELLKNI